MQRKSLSNKAFAVAIGGGVDIAISSKIAIRVGGCGL
jgi:hypothetical protein